MKISKFKFFTAATIVGYITCSSAFCFSLPKNNNDDDNKISSFQYMKKINSVFDFVQQNYVEELDPKILYEGALKGMLDAIGDPYTLYLGPDAMRDLSETTVGTFGGIGATISKPVENTPQKPAYVEIASPMDDSPAAKAGLQTGDFIYAVDGNPTPELTMNEVLGYLRGEVGTPVVLTILRGANMKFDVRIVRDLIEVPTVKFGMIENTGIGYMKLIQFTPETANRVQDALDDFAKNNYSSLIIDLRDNPGGIINGATDVADKFIDKGVIVTTKSRLAYENETFNASKSKTTVKKDIPIIILINRGSASASEILSGALKDYHLAYLIGERTYGKGSVQRVISLSNTDGIKITMARYYSPSDTNIDKIGIPPDFEVKNLESMNAEEEEVFVKLLNSKTVETIAENQPGMTESQIAEEADKIAKEYPLDVRLIRRLLRNQVNRHKPSALYDMDFDLQLQEAIKVINDGNFSQLVKTTKTLKELQEEVAAKEAENL